MLARWKGAWRILWCLLALAVAGLSLAVLASSASSRASASAARRVPFGFFGTVLDPAVTLSVSEPTLSHEMGVMARSGVESVRSNFYWYASEPAPGVFNWTESDKLALAAAWHGLALLPIVEFTPQWASSAPHNHDYVDYPPQDPGTFAAFMQAAIARYGPNGQLWKLFPSLSRYAIRSWQIWNEPAGNFDWRGQPWAASYVKLLRPAYTAIHAADPGAKVVTGAVVGLNGTNLEPWTEAGALYRAGLGRYFDVLAVNAFTSSPSVSQSVARSVEIVGLVRGVLRAHGDGHKPVWVTEVTWPASIGKIQRRFYAGFETTAGGQAARLRAYYAYIASHPSAGISRAYWYTWATSYNTRETANNIPTFAFSGLVRWSPGQSFHTLPVLAAYEREAARWEGCDKTTDAQRCR